MEKQPIVNDSLKSKRKVVHVLPIFPSKSETFIINFILETLEHNYSAQILADAISSIKISSQQNLLEKSGLYATAETYNPNVPTRKFKRLFYAIVLLLKNLKHTSVFIRTLNSKKYGLKSTTLKMWFQASVFLKHRDAHIFHAHFGVNGKLIAEMKEIGAIKGDIITSFYGYDTFSTVETENYYKNYYLETFKSSNHIITSSNYLYNNLIKLNAPKQKIIVNPVGVDVNVFNYKKRNYNSTFNIITVGRLIKLKGQHIGVDVIKVLKDRGYNVHYTVVGLGDESSALQQKVTTMNLEEIVTLCGGGTQKEIIKLLYQNHLFLMTSITDKTGRAEGQGLVSAEAQATGIPVIGFNSGGISETIKNGETGYVVEEGNVIAMADAVEKLILNPDMINVLGSKARFFVEEDFNNRIQSQKIINLYQE